MRIISMKNESIQVEHILFVVKKSSDAAYFDFEFDKLMDIGFRNRILIE